jgi:hypothetical protein
LSDPNRSGSTNTRRRWPWIVLGALLVLAGLAALGARVALRSLERAVTEALGPGVQIARVHVDPTAVVIEGLVVPGGPGWPAAESFRAERVRVVPTWRSLVAGPVAIARIEVASPSLSMLRTPDGRLRLLPSLLERGDAPRDAGAPAVAASPPRTVAIDAIEIAGGTVELYDASVGRTPWRVRIVDLDAQIEDVVAPALAERIPFEARGKLDGPQRDGDVEVGGWFVGATGDLETEARLTGVDLLALEPYLLEATKARLARGTLDLDVRAEVAAKQLHAPGHLVLSQLDFAPGTRAKTRVLGVPRDLLLAALQAKGGRIALDFVLDGRVDDPRFSLNETFGTRIAIALAKELGVGVEGLVEGTLGLGIQSLEGAGKASGSVGSALRKVFPGR